MVWRLIRRILATARGSCALPAYLVAWLPRQFLSDRTLEKWTHGRLARVDAKDLPPAVARECRRARLQSRLAWLPSVVGVVAMVTAIFTQSVARGAESYPCLSMTHPYADARTGFDAMDATDAELACVGLPPRPADPEKLAAWDATWGRVTSFLGDPVWQPSRYRSTLPHFTTPGEVPVGPKVPANGDHAYGAQPWSGYVIHASQNGNPSFNAVMGTFTVPSVPDATTLPPSNVSMIGAWVGIGGAGDAAPSPECPIPQDQKNAGQPAECLIQAGVAIQAGDNAGDAAGYALWWEDYPQLEGFECKDDAGDDTECPQISPGDVVSVSLEHWWPGQTLITMADVTTGQGLSGIYPTPLDYGVDQSAEAILEDLRLAAGVHWPYAPPVSFSDVMAGWETRCSCGTLQPGSNVDFFGTFGTVDPAWANGWDCTSALNYDNDTFQVYDTTGTCPAP